MNACAFCNFSIVMLEPLRGVPFGFFSFGGFGTFGFFCLTGLSIFGGGSYDLPPSTLKMRLMRMLKNRPCIHSRVGSTVSATTFSVSVFPSAFSSLETSVGPARRFSFFGSGATFPANSAAKGKSTSSRISAYFPNPCFSVPTTNARS